MKKNIRSFAINASVIIVGIVIAVAVGQYAAKLRQYLKSHIKDGDYLAHVVNRQYPITLYGTSTCSHCADARAFLNASGIKFNDVVIDKSKDEERNFSQLGESAVPVLIVNSGLITGFRQSEYLDLIKRVRSSTQ